MSSNNLIVAQAYLDHLWSRRNLYFVDLLVAQNCKLSDPLFGEGAGHDHIKAQVCDMHQGFPDLAYTIAEVIANVGDQLALRWSARGIHRGSLMGIPATERAIAISGVLLLRLEKTKLIAITCLWEPYTMLQQLGLVPGAYEIQAPVRTVEARIAAPRAARAPVVDVDAQWDL